MSLLSEPFTMAEGSFLSLSSCFHYNSTAFGRKVFGQVEENHEVWKAAGRLVGHQSGKFHSEPGTSKKVVTLS